MPFLLCAFVFPNHFLFSHFFVPTLTKAYIVFINFLVCICEFSSPFECMCVLFLNFSFIINTKNRNMCDVKRENCLSYGEGNDKKKSLHFVVVLGLVL